MWQITHDNKEELNVKDLVLFLCCCSSDCFQSLGSYESLWPNFLHYYNKAFLLLIWLGWLLVSKGPWTTSSPAIKSQPAAEVAISVSFSCLLWWWGVFQWYLGDTNKPVSLEYWALEFHKAGFWDLSYIPIINIGSTDGLGAGRNCNCPDLPKESGQRYLREFQEKFSPRVPLSPSTWNCRQQ